MIGTHRIARIGRPHGLRGEVTVQVHTDTPQTRFVPGATFETEPAERGPLTLTGVRVHQGTYLLSFAGVPDRTAAERLRDTGLVTSEAEPAPVEDDGWYAEDLLGWSVELLDGTPVGEVSGLHTRPVQDLLEVHLSRGGHALVPFVEELVPEVDEEGRRVVLDPPAGLFDLADDPT
jgi:16S rRNA processing protein RimM